MPFSVVLCLLLAAASPARHDKDEVLARWYEGPVRYLITRREEKEFRETPENEARISFWRRVVEANGLFTESALPGWKTDRGKVYVLIGPPTDIREDPNYSTADRGIAQTGLLRWIYDGVLKPPLSGTFVVPFIRENDGEWHLTTDPRYASPAFDPLASYDRAQADITRIQSSMDYGSSDLGVALDQALIQTPPWQEKDFIDRVTSEAYMGALPLRMTLDYFRSADASTFAVINISVPFSSFLPKAGEKQVPPEITALARLSPEGGGGEIDIAEDAFFASPSNSTAKPEDSLVFQARRPLRPGRYNVYVGLFERVRLLAANLRSTVEIPDLGGPLTVSSIMLGRTLRPVPEGTGGYQRPFRISDFEILPAVGGSFPVGGTFSAFWQVYSEGPSGPGSGLTITTRFYHTGDGGETPVGKPGTIEDALAAQAFTLELTGWPAGSYRFEVSARDRGGRTAVRSAGFTVQ